MNRRIVSFLLTIVSYIAVYRLFRYITDRYFGKESQSSYRRLMSSFATLLLTPRFRYNNQDGADEMQIRLPMVRTYRHLFSFPTKKKGKLGSTNDPRQDEAGPLSTEAPPTQTEAAPAKEVQEDRTPLTEQEPLVNPGEGNGSARL